MDNLVGILVASVAAFAVGALWYTVLFGRRWRMLMNVPEGHMGAPDVNTADKGMSMAGGMIGGFVCTLIMVYVLSLVMRAANVMDATQAVHVALLVSIGFMATVLANAIWYERRPVELYLINVGHYVVAVIVAALVLLQF